VLSSLGGLNERWLTVAQVLLAIPAAALLVGNVSTARGGGRRVLTLFVVVIVLSSLMVLGPEPSADNGFLAPDLTVRTGFKLSEIQAVQTATRLAGPDGLVLDQLYSLLRLSENFTRPPDISQNLYSGNFQNLNGSLVLIRDEVTNNPFQLLAGTFRLNYNVTKDLDSQGFARVYDCGSVFGYVKDTGGS
jgi:hypothetical protein